MILEQQKISGINKNTINLDKTCLLHEVLNQLTMCNCKVPNIYVAMCN